MKATGIVRRIDSLGRIVIPMEIRRTLRIRENDALEIFTDREGEIIFKKYSPIADLDEFAQEYADSLFESTGHIALIADRDEIIAVAGASKKQFMGKALSPEIERLMEERQTVVDNANEAAIVDDYTVIHKSIAPIIHGGDLVGAVLLLSEDKDMGELEKKLCETAADFLAKQLG
ncbi:MAG: stage V sporulation protein T [Limnochordia bacterium]|jgi:AbrB family transcriptional regulator (stage V sporulation protein T)|nr:stage V sporulation protein T [Bacillota bacterium]